MKYFFLILGLFLTLFDIFSLAKTLKSNIIKRLIFLFLGLACIYEIKPSYLLLTYNGVIGSLIIGAIFIITHLAISKGVKLKFSDINYSLIKTCILIYFIELPAEELLYRGILLVPLLKIINPIGAVILSSILFSILHIKTWKNKLIWIASFLLGIICAFSVYKFKSIWAAIIIHNLNDFAYITLINKRNIFIDQNSN